MTKPIHFAVRGRRKEAITAERPDDAPLPGRVLRVAKLMALAIRFDEMLHAGEVQSLSDLARLARVTQPRMTQIMNLLHLAPDIQEAILHLPPVTEGRDPITEREMRMLTAMDDWQAQRCHWTVLSAG